MSNLLTKNSNALRLLMTEDLYILSEIVQLTPTKAPQPPVITNQLPADVPAQVIPETPIQGSKEILAEKPTEAQKNKEFNYLGENNKYFLILIDEPKQKDISSIHKETLLKIMSAKGMELRDLAVLNLNQYPGASFTDLKDFFSFNKIVLFGIDPQRIALSAQSSNQIVKQDTAKILCTYGIDEMIKDNNKKREFWSVMKNF